MNLHPFYNGNAYGWGRLRSLFDFFFPYPVVDRTKVCKKRHKLNGVATIRHWHYHQYIRAEAKTHYKKGYGVVSRDFYTFRAFAVHYWNTLVVSKFRQLASVELRVAQALLVSGIIVPVGIYLAIATDAGSMSGFATSNNATFAQTCTGSNGILFVGSYEAETGSSLWTSTKYAGTTMNIAGTDNIATATTYYGRHEFLAPPATGTNNVVVSFSAGTAQHEATAFSYSGALATSMIDATHTDAASGTGTFTLTSSVTTVSDNDWVNGFFWSNGAMASTDVMTGTYRQDGADSTLMVDNNAVKTPAGSVTLACRQTSSGSRNIKSILSAFAPAVAVSTNTEWSHPTNQPSSHWNTNIGFA